MYMYNKKNIKAKNKNKFIFVIHKWIHINIDYRLFIDNYILINYKINLNFL